MTDRPGQGSDRQMAESQLSELQNMRVLLEEARGLSRNLSFPGISLLGTSMNSGAQNTNLTQM